jgi:hypothetical protein
VTDRPRTALRQPRSLTPEQLLDNLVTHPDAPTPVTAWVLWEDGVEEQVTGQAVAWTRRAVRVRFGAPPHLHEVWVWVGAVQRQEEVGRPTPGEGGRRAAAVVPRPQTASGEPGTKGPGDGNDVRR